MAHEKSSLPESVAEKLRQGAISQDAAEAFLNHVRRVERKIYGHPVIQHNPYTQWFKLGNANTAQVENLVVQFSVFSNYFITLEAKRMVNAATEAEEREARNILGSEIGVPIDVETGEIEGFRFSHNHAHIKWLRDLGEMLGLDRNRLGKWAVGSDSTHRFLEDLEKVYGHPDNSIGSGASFAIETWAGFGIGKGPEMESCNFWNELIVGLQGYNRHYREPAGLPPLPTGFFKFHFGLELGHVANVEHELSETFFRKDFNAETWFAGANHALDAIFVFWEGLEVCRRTLE